MLGVAVTILTYPFVGAAVSDVNLKTNKQKKQQKTTKNKTKQAQEQTKKQKQHTHKIPAIAATNAITAIRNPLRVCDGPAGRWDCHWRPQEASRAHGGALLLRLCAQLT